MRAALAELVRREVLSVSADPLSPERGSYRFAQQMLRQVAYDTLSRRDRKARHLKVAAHLRAAFPGDGEEVADVIARHYLDALDAVPGRPRRRPDPRAGHRRADPGRRTRRAHRRPRPGRCQLCHRRELTLAGPPAQTAADGQPSAGMLWERAAEAADHQRRLGRGRRASRAGPAITICRHGQARAAARAQAIAGRGAAPVGPPRRSARSAHRRRGGAAGRSRHRHGARPGGTGGRGGVRRLAGRRPAHHRGADPSARPSASATGQLGRLFITRGIYLACAGRRPKRSPTSAKARGSPSQAGDNIRLGRALLNLADALAVTDPAAAAEAARTAAGHLRRVGDRDYLAFAIAQPGPGAADARRLGRRRGRTHPGRGLRRAGRLRLPRLLPGLAGGAARRRRHRPGHAGRDCRTCGPAKIPRTRR